MKTRCSRFACALLAALAAREARAGDRDASTFFEEGASAYARGEFRAAALAFEEAYRRAPRGATIYDAAMAWELAKTWERAADDFELALDDAKLEPKHADEARAHLAGLEKRVAHVVITAPAGVVLSVAHAEREHAPLRVHLVPGQHAVRAVYPAGETVTRALAVAAGDRAALEFEPRSTAAPAAPPAAATPLRERDAPAETASADGSPRAVRPGWFVVGGAAATATASSVLGLIALGARSDFEQSGYRDEGAHDRAVTFRGAANVGWITTGALAATGLVILLLDKGEPAPRSAR